MDAPIPLNPLPPPPRLGPRPLPLHLTTEGWLLQMSFAGLTPALTPSSGGSPLSNLLRLLAAEHQSQFDPARFVDALTRAAKARLDQLVAGIVRYQTHEYRRTRQAPPGIWKNGSARLRDYGGPETGPVAVFVPSLINRAYILDLAEDRSLLGFMANSGVRSYLLDWGAPAAAERGFHTEDYVKGVLIPALEHVGAITGRKPCLVGYCMGGTLTAAAAVLRPDLISGLGLLAAPWDFHDGSAASRQFIAAFKPLIEAMLETFGAAPVDFLQMLFASLDPMLVSRKFRAFAFKTPETEAARRFVELEDWLNDGIDLAAPVARECLFAWYGENRPHKNEWRIAGRVIDPAAISAPALVVIPSHDRIVPPASAMALAQRIPACQTMTVDLGHIGMIAGGRAPSLVYAPLAKWIKNPAEAVSA